MTFAVKMRYPSLESNVTLYITYETAGDRLNNGKLVKATSYFDDGVVFWEASSRGIFEPWELKIDFGALWQRLYKAPTFPDQEYKLERSYHFEDVPVNNPEASFRNPNFFPEKFAILYENEPLFSAGLLEPIGEVGEEEVVLMGKLIKLTKGRKGDSTNSRIDALREIELDLLSALTFSGDRREGYAPLSDAFRNLDRITQFNELKGSNNGLYMTNYVLKEYLDKTEDESFTEPVKLLKNILINSIMYDIVRKRYHEDNDNSKNNFKALIHAVIDEGTSKSFSYLSKSLGEAEFIPAIRSKAVRYFTTHSQDSYLHSLLADFEERLNHAGREFLKKYAEKFGFANEIVFETSEDSAITRIFFLKDGIKENIVDTGYGYSQLLPVILKISLVISDNYPDRRYGLEKDGTYSNSKGDYKPSLVFIEEPESNLHPALQSKLADMFFEAYQKFNIQFVVETHSEYLIRRLQVMTADPACEMTPEDTQIHYFYHPDDIPEGELQVYPINIQEDGALSKNFGKGFFDESSNLNVALYNFTRNNYN